MGMTMFQQKIQLSRFGRLMFVVYYTRDEDHLYP